MEGIYVGADGSTTSIHVHLFKNRNTELFADWKAFPDEFPFRRTCSSTRASSQQKMPGACIRNMKKRISSQPTLDRTDMPLRHQKQIHRLPAKSAKNQPPQNR